MKQDIKNKDFRERQTYVPASVKVIEVTVQKIICQSGGIDSMLRDQEDGGNAFN